MNEAEKLGKLPCHSQGLHLRGETEQLPQYLNSSGAALEM